MPSPGASAALRGRKDYFPGASFGADFTRGRYKLGKRQARNPASLPGWTFTRASTGYAETAAGALVAFASGAPRITDKGLLVEEARTNLLLRSQEFDNASWTKTDETVTADAVAAPDGTITADLITDGTAGNAQLTQNPAVTSTVTYTATRYIKRGNNDWVLLRCYDAGSSANVARVWVNLATGAIGTANAGGAGVAFVAAAVTAAAAGFYRVSLTFTPTPTSIVVATLAVTADASTTRVNNATRYEWGAQLEAGGSSTSYIPTTSGQATRQADIPAVGGLSAAAPLTLVVEYIRTSDHGSIQASGQVDDGDNNDCLLAYISDADFVNGFVNAAGVAQADFGFSVTATVGATVKQAIRFATDDCRHAVNGTLGTADTSATMPTGLTTLRLGTRASGNYLGGYLRRLIVYPYAFTDAALQAATA